MGRRILFAVLGVLACTDVKLGVAPPPPVPLADNRLAITADICTLPATNVAFPVKILFLIDLSNSMCYSDPASGACTPLRCDQGPNNPLTNPTPPRRAQAVRDVIDHFAGNPAVSFAVVTFSSSVDAAPYDTTHQVFTTDVRQLNLDRLRNVDSVTDYQGALSRAETLLSLDMADVAEHRRSELPRTKYAVVLLTDGTPFPRCSRALPSTNNPPDSQTCSFQPSTCTICQAGGSMSLFPSLGAGQDYNTTYQLVQLVDQMHLLAETYAVGGLKFHTALLRVPNALECCPGCFADDPDGALAASLLTTLAQPERNHGTFVEFTASQDISFLNYDFTSLRERFALRSFFVDNQNSVITAHGLELDTDGDGLSDPDEFRRGLTSLAADSDGDGYSDLFEVRKGPPFDPLTAQVGRCSAHSAKCGGGRLCDTDGDGLRDCEEFELGSDPELVDSDADGIPDGLELRRGMDPARNDTHEDLDFDGIPNIDELLNGTAVDERDNRSGEEWSVQLSLAPRPSTEDGRSCYALGGRGVTLPTPRSRLPSGLPDGWSDTLVWVSEAPAGDLRDYGRVRVACVRSRFVPPALRLPLAPTVQLSDEDFHDPAAFRPDRDCRGAAP